MDKHTFAADDAAQHLLTILDTPPVGWAALFAELTGTERLEDITALAEAAAVELLLFTAYTEARRAGDPHEVAVTSAMRLRRAVRKLLGFSYPAAGEFTF